MSFVKETHTDFNPRTPCGVRPSRTSKERLTAYFNPRTPCGVRHLRSSTFGACRYFNPRTPCGVRLYFGKRETAEKEFQSTHPLRGATRGAFTSCLSNLDFNPRTPCGVRLETCQLKGKRIVFQSTHPLRGATGLFPEKYAAFQEISIHAPLAGCDRGKHCCCGSGRISIHAPLAGCDRSWTADCSCATDFNPRTPCGVRLPQR